MPFVCRSNTGLVLPRVSRGFTLVEVLVAMLVMAIMAVLSWQGVDGMARANEANRQRADSLAAMQAALQQWKSDLDAIISPKPNSPLPEGQPGATAQALEFDGRVLRLTRVMANQEVRVVAWGSPRGGVGVQAERAWIRWVSEPVRNRQQWQAAWDQAARWGQSPSAVDRSGETVVAQITDWQLFFFRNDSWSNPQSDAQLGDPPQGVRLRLRLAPRQLPGGPLQVDWSTGKRGGGA